MSSELESDRATLVNLALLGPKVLVTMRPRPSRKFDKPAVRIMLQVTRIQVVRSLLDSERGLRYRNLGASVHATRHSSPIRGLWLRPYPRPLVTAPAWTFRGRVCCRQAQSPRAATAVGPSQDGRGALRGHGGCQWRGRGRGAGLRLGAFGIRLRGQGLAASTGPSPPESPARAAPSRLFCVTVMRRGIGAHDSDDSQGY